MYVQSSGYMYENNDVRQPTQTLDKDAFLKILVNQLRYQNPMSPQGSNEFMTQIIQFSMIEQLTNLNTKLEQVFSAQEFSRATGLIGKEVTIWVEEDLFVTAVVEKVILHDGKPMLVIEDNMYELGRLISVNELSNKPEPKPEPDPEPELEPGSEAGSEDETGNNDSEEVQEA